MLKVPWGGLRGLDMKRGRGIALCGGACVLLGLGLARNIVLSDIAKSAPRPLFWLGAALPLLVWAAVVLRRLWLSPPTARLTGGLWQLVVVAAGLQLAAVGSQRLELACPAALMLSPAANSYVQTAVEQGDLWRLLRDYDRKMPGFVSHAQTQAAGPVVLFGLLHHFYRRLTPPHAVAEVAVGLAPGVPVATLASSFSRWWNWRIEAADVCAGWLTAVTIMWLAALGVVATGRLGETLAGPRGAALAAGTYVLVPGMALYGSTLDGLYAALVAALLLAAGRAQAAGAAGRRRTAWAWALLAGAWLALGLFLSLGMLVIAVGLVLVVALRQFAPASLAGESAAAPWRLLLTVLGVPLVAFGVLRLAAGYDVLAVMRVSDQLRMRGYNELWNRPFWPSLWRNGWEAGVFLGPPLILATLWAWQRLVRRADRRRLATLLLGMLAAVAMTVLTGRIRGETSRMWLFLTPLVAMAVTPLSDLEEPGDLANLRWRALLAATWCVGLRLLVDVWQI